MTLQGCRKDLVDLLDLAVFSVFFCIVAWQVSNVQSLKLYQLEKIY